MKPHKTRRSKTAPCLNTKSNRAQMKPGTNMDDQNSTMSTIRPSSERTVLVQRKSTEPRNKTATTTSSNSAKSRQRGGYGSAPSSRRTSCTLIDPSRPTRHYRINSSQNVPAITRDVDDVLALHFRACSLFQSSSYQPSLPSPTMSAHGPSVTATEIGAATETLHYQSTYDSDVGPLDEKTIATADVEDTTMHWMSPSTRKKQYDKIDRANSGLGSMIRRILPRCVSGPGPQRFHDDEKSDAGSVRRYRVGVPDDEDDAQSTSGLRMQRRRLERMTTDGAKKEKRFGCF